MAAGDTVVLLESMKMEIPVLVDAPGTVRAIKVAPGDVVQEGDVLVEIVPTDRGFRYAGRDFLRQSRGYSISLQATSLRRLRLGSERGRDSNPR